MYFNQNATFGTAPVCGTFLEKQAPDLEVPSLSGGKHNIQNKNSQVLDAVLNLGFTY